MACSDKVYNIAIVRNPFMKLYMLFFAVCLSAIGCSNSENSNSGNTDQMPNGRNWVLVSYGLETGDSIPAVDDVQFTLTYNLTGGDQITGFAGFDGCNAFSSTEVIHEGENILPVNGVNVDGAVCGNLQFAEYLQQFDHFYSVISNTFSSQAIDSKLQLKSPSEQYLLFDPCNPVDPNSLDSICEPI